RLAFAMNKPSRNRQLPERQAFVDLEAVQDGAVGLVHAVAEDQLPIDDGRRADCGQFQIRGGLGPRRALGRYRIDVEARKRGNVEGAEAGDVELVAEWRRRGDEV